MLPLLPLVPIAAVAAVTKFKLSGEKLTKYDVPHDVTFNVDPESEGVQAVNDFLLKNFMNSAPTRSLKSGAFKEVFKTNLPKRRSKFDQMSQGRDFDCEHRPDLIRLDERSIPGEWVLVAGADPGRRILYLHGGAFMVGSAISHRAITYNLAKRTKAAVFAPDYRLMPEHSRQDITEDAQAAYDWILNTGPNGPRKAQRLAIGGDSAGASLTLALLAWARSTKRRTANAAFVFSAPVDTTFQSPSLRENYKTDLMLQSFASSFLKLPRSARLWVCWKILGLSPAHPSVSPIMGSLHKLPPLLMQVSRHEMLFDDSVRYAEKSTRAGNDVTLQSWSHVPHTFQFFDKMLPEATRAMDEVAAFLSGKL
ncbi:MAG: alpha/beta hydrolase [Maricaulaceae bacterium]